MYFKNRMQLESPHSAARPGLLSSKLENLSLVAAILSLLLGLGMAIAKFLAVSHAFTNESLTSRLGVLFKAMPLEMLSVGALLAIALASARLAQRSKGARIAALCFMYGAFAAMLALSFVNVELFRQIGSPVKYHMVLLAPAVGRDLLRSGVSDKLGGMLFCAVLLAGAFVFVGLLCRWANSRCTGPWQRRASWAASAAMCGCGALLFSQQPRGFREALLRDMHVFSMILPSGTPSTETVLAAPSALEQRVMAQLCGAPESRGQSAFAALPRKRHNVIVWVWESVGERYLKSHHPLGEAATPHLDEWLGKGGVRFSNCYSQCPLTIQTAWTLMTGLMPPARANIFTAGETLPPHGKTLPALFREAGYKTAKIQTGKTEIWNVRRVLGLQPGFELNEDSDNLANRAEHKANNWGIEDAALVPRANTFIDSVPRDNPFFLMLWNVDTHHPYVWPDMPGDLREAKEKQRYIAAVEHTDEILGELHASLVKRGIDQDTLLIIVGDHGEGHGRAPDRPYERAHSMLVYEDSIHIPLLFLHPALKPKGEPLDPVCSITDIVPTVLDLCGIPLKQETDGRSLAGSFQQRPVYCRSILWWPMSSRVGRYKLLLESADARPQLYDIPSDPYETNDLAEREVDLTNALMCDLIREADRRYKTDISFKHHFFSLQKVTDQARPGVEEMLRP
jgi:arylsulfatase A-like enzyme